MEFRFYTFPIYVAFSDQIIGYEERGRERQSFLTNCTAARIIADEGGDNADDKFVYEWNWKWTTTTQWAPLWMLKLNAATNKQTTTTTTTKKIKINRKVRAVVRNVSVYLSSYCFYMLWYASHGWSFINSRNACHLDIIWIFCRFFKSTNFNAMLSRTHRSRCFRHVKCQTLKLIRLNIIKYNLRTTPRIHHAITDSII